MSKQVILSASDARSAIPCFDSELAYKPTLAARFLIIAIAAPLLVFVLGETPGMTRMIMDPCVATLARWPLAGLWLVVIGCSIRLPLCARDRFVVGKDRITLRDWRSTKTLLFTDLASCTVVLEDRTQPRAPTVRGTRVTFLSNRTEAAPLSLFINGRAPIDMAIVERLKLLPMLPHRALKALEMAAKPRPQGW